MTGGVGALGGVSIPGVGRALVLAPRHVLLFVVEMRRMKGMRVVARPTPALVTPRGPCQMGGRGVPLKGHLE